MQRQSLGSPATKLPISVDGAALNGGPPEDKEERRWSSVAIAEAEADTKAEKAIRWTSSDRSIHLIPVLTLLCVLVLYLLSHDPTVTAEIDLGIGGGDAAVLRQGSDVVEVSGGNGGVAVGRNYRRLMAVETVKKLRYRKLGKH